MKKSVYSLVLMDDVVAAIDELAYSYGTSRSNLINQILADKVAMITPSKRLDNIFTSLSDYLRPYNNFQILSQPSDHMYSIKSALRYKYNPTIKYSISLESKSHRLEGSIRIVSRTQSEVLYFLLRDFFMLWAEIENEHYEKRWLQEDGCKWSRSLNLDELEVGENQESLAEVLSSYIKGLDDGLKIFFTNNNDINLRNKLVREHYNERFASDKVLLKL